MAKHIPGPWKVGPFSSDVWGPSAKGGDTKICDIRAWGYLTGKGAGALGLTSEEAVAIQAANARLIAAAPDMLAALERVERVMTDLGAKGEPLKTVRAAIARATSEA